MGQKISDGKAFDETVPGGHAVVDGELYRINGKNGIAIGDVDTNDANNPFGRSLSFEMDTNAIYSILVPAGVNPSPGALLFWSGAASTAFQSAATDIHGSEPAASGDAACFWVTGAKNNNGYIQGRVLNGVPGTAHDNS